nr:hypothetical protein [Paraburkholderia youngii]
MIALALAVSSALSGCSSLYSEGAVAGAGIAGAEDDEHGRVTVSRLMSTGALDCKEIVFSVDQNATRDKPASSAFYIASVYPFDGPYGDSIRAIAINLNPARSRRSHRARCGTFDAGGPVPRPA